MMHISGGMERDSIEFHHTKNGTQFNTSIVYFQNIAFVVFGLQSSN